MNLRLRTNYKKEFYFTSIRNPRDRYLSNYYRNKRDFEKMAINL